MKCPACNRKGVPQGELFYCPHCRALFDDQPDEGGSYSDRNPAARLEREERQKLRKPFQRR